MHACTFACIGSQAGVSESQARSLMGPDSRGAWGPMLVSGCTCRPPAQGVSDLRCSGITRDLVKMQVLAQSVRSSCVSDRRLHFEWLGPPRWAECWAGLAGVCPGEERARASQLVRNMVRRMNWGISLSVSRGRRLSLEESRTWRLGGADDTCVCTWGPSCEHRGGSDGRPGSVLSASHAWFAPTTAPWGGPRFCPFSEMRAILLLAQGPAGQ